MTIDHLHDVRSIARARAVEDLEFFANTVLAARLDVSFCDAVQKGIERGDLDVSVFDPYRQKVVSAWLCVLGRAHKLQSAPTETFSWLFGEYVERRKAA